MRQPGDQDVAVHGLGVQTAFGDTQDTWDGLASGQTAVRALSSGVQAARVDDPTLVAELDRVLAPQLKFLSGSGVMAAKSAREAWDESDSDDVRDTRRGLYLAQMDSDDWNCRDFRASAHAASDDLSQPVDQAAMNKASLRNLHPYFLLEGLKNNAFSFLATWLELRGANTSTAGCTSLGTTLLDMARRAIQCGALDRAVVTGASRFTSTTALFELEQQHLNALVPGDAAGTVVLGPARTGVPAIVGIGSATHMNDDAGARPDALANALTAAMAQADAAPADLTAIIAPGTGLPAEAAALATLRERVPDTPFVCFAGALGHTTLASSTTQLALAARSLQAGALPYTEAIDLPTGSALAVLSLGSFGHAGAVVVRS